MDWARLATGIAISRLTNPNVGRRLMTPTAASWSASPMAQDKPPYTSFVSKKLASGRMKDYWRFRRDGINTTLPGQPGEAKFYKRYGELMEQAESEQARVAEAATARGTFQWLTESYLDSAEFTHLAAKTQSDYRATIDQHLLPALGPERFDCITKRSVKAVRDAVAKTHSARTAHKIKQMTSRLYSWADEESLLPDGFINPAMSIRKIKSKTKPIEVWSREEITLFLAKGAAIMRTPVMLALYTGQRREDLVQMEWTDVQGDMIRVRQNKTGEPLTIPMHSDLKQHLKAIRTKFNGPILRSEDGTPMNANQLSSAMYRAVTKLDEMPQRSLHGLRYAAAAALEEAGCSVVQISSIIGHRTYQMAIKYARQRRDAEAAMAKREQRA
jgi:integrase